MVIGTYDHSDVTSRFLKHKNYYARTLEPGEDPKDLLKLEHRSGTQKPKSIAKPAMSASEKEAYYKLFSKAAQTRHLCARHEVSLTSVLGSPDPSYRSRADLTPPRQ